MNQVKTDYPDCGLINNVGGNWWKLMETCRNWGKLMESNSEPMRINISEETYALVKDKIANLTFEKRKAIDVKGIGLKTLYFVE